MLSDTEKPPAENIFIRKPRPDFPSKICRRNSPIQHRFRVNLIWPLQKRPLVEINNSIWKAYPISLLVVFWHRLYLIILKLRVLNLVDSLNLVFNRLAVGIFRLSFTIQKLFDFFCFMISYVERPLLILGQGYFTEKAFSLMKPQKTPWVNLLWIRYQPSKSIEPFN